MSLAVECAAGREEGPGVGDRVGHAEPVLAPGEVHGLVEVARARRVDRHELELDPLALHVRQPLGLGECLGGELAGQVELATDRREPLLEGAWPLYVPTGCQAVLSSIKGSSRVNESVCGAGRDTRLTVSAASVSTVVATSSS